jgi:hypothetical protein
MLNSVKNNSGRKLLEADGKRREVIEEISYRLFRDAFAFFPGKQSIQNFVWPEGGNNCGVTLFEQAGDVFSCGSILIRKAPCKDNGSVEDKSAHRRPSLIRSLILSPRNDSLLRLPKLAKRSAASAGEPFCADMRSFRRAPSNRETLVS